MKGRTFFALTVAVAALAAILLLSRKPAASQEAPPPKTEAPKTEPVVVRRSLASNPRWLDPHIAGDVISSQQASMAYESLYEYDYFAQPCKVIPLLAAEMPKTSEDGKTVTITLRKDVFFQDDKCFPGGKGRQMKAKDVVFSLKRMAAMNNARGYWTVEDCVVGLDAFRETAIKSLAGIEEAAELAKRLKAAWDTDVPGVRATDEFTVQYRLTKRYPQFINALCMSYTAVVAREAVELYGDALMNHPVGTGPFRLAKYEPFKELLWERNPTYRSSAVFPKPAGVVKIGEQAVDPAAFAPFVGKQLPLADKVSFVMQTAQNDWQMFKDGGLDAVPLTELAYFTAFPFERKGKLSEEFERRGVTSERFVRPVIEFVNFNMDDLKIGTKGGDAGKAIRKAVSLSLDRKHYIDRYLAGRGVEANMLVTPDTPEYDAKYAGDMGTFDAARGRELLETAGFVLEEKGQPGEWVATDPTTLKQATVHILLRGVGVTSQEVGEWLESCGKKVGVKITTELNEFPTFLRKQDKGEGQAYNAGWVVDYPDAQNVMQLLYGANAVEQGINNSRYKNAEYDKLYLELAALDSAVPEQAAKKKTLTKKLHEVADEDCPIALIYYLRQTRLRHSWTLPVIPNDYNYSLMKYAHSDPAKRAAAIESWKNPPSEKSDAPKKAADAEKTGAAEKTGGSDKTGSTDKPAAPGGK
jgi:oligopeptide transport system substrate-binding protein